MTRKNKGKYIKQINNLKIYYIEAHQYTVWTPDNRCEKDGLSLEEAELYCARCKDYLRG